MRPAARIKAIKTIHEGRKDNFVRHGGRAKEGRTVVAVGLCMTLPHGNEQGVPREPGALGEERLRRRRGLVGRFV
jgi:hypothetical protein